MSFFSGFLIIIIELREFQWPTRIPDYFQLPDSNTESRSSWLAQLITALLKFNNSNASWEQLSWPLLQAYSMSDSQLDTAGAPGADRAGAAPTH